MIIIISKRAATHQTQNFVHHLWNRQGYLNADRLQTPSEVDCSELPTVANTRVQAQLAALVLKARVHMCQTQSSLLISKWLNLAGIM